jgi:predicted nucleotidyltransferase
MSPELDAPRLERVVQQIADQLRGDWLLIGGALVALWLDGRRVTEDVDLVGLEETGATRLGLLSVASTLGLPVEALNSAADFFVAQIPDWREHLVVFRTGRSGRIFRPTPTLFLLLKLRRLSSRDLDDCLELLARARREGLSVDVNRVRRAVDALQTADDAALIVRRQRLIAALPPTEETT